MPKLKMSTLKDGTTVYGAHVRVRPFKAVFQTFPTKAEATTWSTSLTKQLREQRRLGSVRKDLAAITVGGINAAYLSDPETLALRDMKDRKRQIEWWSKHYGKVRAMAFDVLAIREGRDRLLREGRKVATVNNYLAAQRRAWTWYGLSGAWPKEVMLSYPDARTRHLNDKELADLLKAALNNSPTMYACVVLAIATGARQGEMIRVRWCDIDIDRQMVAYYKTKTDPARGVHVPQFAMDALLRIKPEGSPDAFVFVNDKGEWMDREKINWQWELILKESGINDFRWHDLRHSCASLLADNGANLLEIGTVLGHKSTQTTLKYVHMVTAKPVTGHVELNAKLSKHSPKG